MKTLIWQQLHLRSEGQGKLWAVSQELIRRLNPDCDLLVIDNASPLDPLGFTPGYRWVQCRLGPMSEMVPTLDPGRHVGSKAPALIRFHESIGHFFHGHTWGLPVRDGPGRAHTLAWNIAMDSGYDRAVYLEADALFRHPVQWGFERMAPGPGVAAQPGGKYYSADWQIWWVNDLRWFREFDFTGKYDWKSRVGEPGGEPAAEDIYIRIFGEVLQRLPVTGDRGDATQLSAANLEEQYPQGLDLITHVHLCCFARWLELEGHPDLARRLWP